MPGSAELSAAPGAEGPLLVVCGERLEAPERAALAARLAADAPSIDVLVVEQLCAKPSALLAALAGRNESALVVAACDHAGAAGALREAVSAGLDTARAGTVSLALALAQARPVERARLLEAVCLAGARKAGVLAGEPLAGRERLQLRGALSRRGLLTPWRETPRRTAVLDEDRCPGARRCGACIAACPARALRVDGALLRVDPLRCTSCGRCVLPCPTEALSLPGAPLGGVAIELETLLGEGVTALTLVCGHGPPPLGPGAEGALSSLGAPVALPCVAMTGPGLLLGLLDRGASVELAPCRACPSEQALEHTAAFVERVLCALGRSDLAEQLFRPGTGRESDMGGAAPRRSLGLITGTPGPLFLREPMATNAAVARLLDEAGGSPLAEEAILDDGAPSGVVRIDPEACSYCGACVLACPTLAIALNREDRELVVDATRCLGCGRCAAACPEKAVHVTRGVDLQALGAGPMRLRRPVCSWTCARCGTEVHDDPILTPVVQRLAAAGASTALVASLRRCSSCGAPAPSSP